MSAVPQNEWRSVETPRHVDSVSVVVVHFEQAADLRRTLTALARQIGVGIREVIVADDGSSTAPSLPSTLGGVPLLLVSQPDSGVRPAAARNLGAERATGDVIVFLDADTAPAPNAVARLAALPSVVPDAVTVGRRHHVDLVDIEEADFLALLDGAAASSVPRFDDPPWLIDLYRRTDDLRLVDDRSYQGIIGAAMALSRAFFEELGGFDATIIGYGGEDWELAYRAYCAGAVLAHVADADVFHNGPDWNGRRDRWDHKNSERRALAARMPTSGSGLRTPFPRLVVDVSNGGWDDDETLIVLDSLLRHSPVPTFIQLEGPLHDQRLVAGDSRVTTEPIDGTVRARALYHLSISAPVVFPSSSGLIALLETVAPGAAGRTSVRSGAETVAVITSVRAQARSRRWADAGHDTDDERYSDKVSSMRRHLFGDSVVDMLELGWQLCGPDRRLADWITL